MDDVVLEEENQSLFLITRHVISTVDESFIRHLFELEQQHMLSADYKRHCIDQGSTSVRALCIQWIVEVRDYFKFCPASVLLAVNYCDRFLSSRLNHPFKESKMYQLVSVVCMLLGVKMKENICQSALTVLSILKPSYVFDGNRVKETELMVLKQLQWELRSVTPIDFIPYFMSNLPRLPPTCHTQDIADITSDLILNTISIPCFLEYSPSVVGAAAVLWANIPFNIESYDQGLYDTFDKDTMRRCIRDMEINS